MSLQQAVISFTYTAYPMIQRPDRRSFIRSLVKLSYCDIIIELKYNTSSIVIVGDWNLTLNPELDCKNYKNINNPRARNEVLRIMNELNLYDVWREENLEEKLYTWKRKLEVDKIQMGRLDFFLLTENVLKYSCSENIVPGYRTDHSLIE